MTQEIITVPFMGSQLLAVVTPAGKYVAIKPISDEFGLSWPGQFRRINRDALLSRGTYETAIPSLRGGNQNTLCLHIDYINAWLFGISINHVKLELRERLMTFQLECNKALNEYFTKKYTLPQQSPAPTALPPYEPYSEPGAHGVYLGHDGKGKEEPYYIDEPLRDPDEERYAQHCAKNQQTDVRIMRPLVKRAMERQIREGIIPDRFVPGVVGFEWSARYIEMSRDKIGLQRDQPSLRHIN